MKKLILTVISVFFLSLTINAQTIKQHNYWFSELVGKANLSGKSISIELEMPAESDNQSIEQIRNLKGKVSSFSTMTEAMNYIDEQGWEFVQAYMVAQGDFNRYRWVIKKIKK